MSTIEPNKDYRILNEEIEFKLKEISDWIGSQLPEGWGFTLLLNSFGPNSQLFFMSNVRREDMLEMLQKFINLQKNQKPNQLPPEAGSPPPVDPPTVP